MNSHRYCIIIFLLTSSYIVNGNDDNITTIINPVTESDYTTTNLPATHVTQALEERNDVYYVYPEAEDSVKKINDVFVIYPEPSNISKMYDYNITLIDGIETTTNVIVTTTDLIEMTTEEPSTTKVNEINITTEKSVIDETVQEKVVKIRNQLYKAAKLRYRKGNRVQLKIEKIKLDEPSVKIYDTTVKNDLNISDVHNETDLLTSETQERVHTLIDSRKDLSNLDIIPFTFDDVVVPSLGRNNIVESQDGDDTGSDQVKDESKDDVIRYQKSDEMKDNSMSAPNEEKPVMNQHLVMWSGYMSEESTTIDNNPWNELLIIGPIPKILPNIYKQRHESFKDQLELPST